MTATASTETPSQIITPGHYEVLAGPPIKPPTPKELFDYQVETLRSKDLAGYDIADPFRNRLPERGLFLLLPPPPKPPDFAKLMALVELGGKFGVSYINPAYLTDLVEVPATASLLLDVEDGRERLNTKPSVSRENITREKRHPYTTWRGIIHGILFPMVLSHHNMNLCGSLYEDGNVPVLCLFGGEPGLDADWGGHADPEWGAPSCGSVLVP